jgi:hypothetical protein
MAKRCKAKCGLDFFQQDLGEISAAWQRSDGHRITAQS